MKLTIKILCVLLAVFTVIVPLAACGKKADGGEATESTGSDTEPTAFAKVPEDMVSETVTISDDTYFTTPSTKDLSVAEDGCTVFVNNTVFVYAYRYTPISDIEVLAEKYKAEIVGENGLDIYQLRFKKAMTMDELNDLTAKLEGEDCVELCDTDQLIDIGQSYMPNDKWYDNDFEDKEDDGDKKKNLWAVEAINAPDAWEYLGSMSKVNVGVVEADIATDHRDLNVKEFFIPSASAKLAQALDSKSHGCHVAGTMAAIADNGKGIAGVCAIPGTEIYACGNSGYITVKNAMFGLTELVQRYNVKVINISQFSNSEAAIIGASHGNKKAQNAIKDQGRRAAEPLKRLLDDGYEFVIVIAAGNQNITKCWKDSSDLIGYGYTTDSSAPFKGKTVYTGAEAKYAHYLCTVEDKALRDRIIVVGAMEKDENGDYRSRSDSNTGDRVDIMAPGTDIFSCKRENTYGLNGGTSMAAPHVSGTAAMVFGCDPSLTGAEVKDIIVTTADYSKVYNKVNAGLLQTDRAVELALGICDFEQFNGLWSYVDLNYESIETIFDDVGFFDTMDYSDKWYATGYYDDRASVVFEFDKSEEGDPDAVPTTMTVSALGDERVSITEEIELGMDYHDAELLDNVVTLRQDSDYVILMQTIDAGYEITMVFEVDGLEASLSSVTVSRVE